MDDENDNRPPHRGLKKGLYVIPTLFTAANVAMGFLAVLMSIRGYHASFGDLESAAHYFNMSALAIGVGDIAWVHACADLLQPVHEDGDLAIHQAHGCDELPAFVGLLARATP